MKFFFYPTKKVKDKFGNMFIVTITCLLLIQHYHCSRTIDAVSTIQENTMAQNVPLILRLMASSVTAATRAGKIIKDVMSKGELGIIDKVSEEKKLFVKQS